MQKVEWPTLKYALSTFLGYGVVAAFGMFFVGLVCALVAFPAAAIGLGLGLLIRPVIRPALQWAKRATKAFMDANSFPGWHASPKAH